MQKNRFIWACILIIFPAFISAQQSMDLGRMTIYENHFFNEILKALQSPEQDGRTVFQAIPSQVDFPKSTDEFTMIWKHMPVSQGRTGTCWDYSASSFMESEIYRITGKGIKLSEMFIAYHEYISKTEEFIDTKGASHFGEGSEANAVVRQMKKHGLMPLSAYDGNARHTAYPDHRQMFRDLKSLLDSYKAKDHWDRELILSGTRTILNHYMGEPPTEFIYEGVKHTPATFMKEICQLKPEDYIDFMSLKSDPYWTRTEYKVPDNYWHSRDYHNVPLEDFMAIIKKAVKSGYSVAIGGDVSESGYLPQYDIAFVPSFDIPSAYIDENARQLRFSNGSTTDDHGVHVVGYKEADQGKWWFLIKDSSSSSFNGRQKGYYFYHEDYIRLKMMNFTVHRDVVRELLSKF